MGAPYTRLLGLEIGDYVQAKYVDGSLILSAWQDEEEVPFDGTSEANLDITETCSFQAPVQCPMPA